MYLKMGTFFLHVSKKLPRFFLLPPTFNCEVPDQSCVGPRVQYTNNLYRPKKHYLPLTKLANLTVPLSARWADSVDCRKFVLVLKNHII